MKKDSGLSADSLMQKVLSLKQEKPALAWLISLLEHQFIRFLLVGFINTLFGYSVFALFIILGAHYTIAVLFSTILGVLFNFKSTGSLVFKSRNNRMLIGFCLVYTIMYFVNCFSLKGLLTLGLEIFPASALLILPMALMSFALNKHLVFREEKIK